MRPDQTVGAATCWGFSLEDPVERRILADAEGPK